MTGVLRTAALSLAIIVAAGQGAAADDVVMPYACKVSGDTLSLTPAQPSTYQIAGARDERIHEACGLDDAGRQVCTHLTVHRFDIKCEGGAVSWAKVAEAARALGNTLPPGLPAGYAPTAVLQARIVLPAQARFAANPAMGVTREALSADSVVMPHDATDTATAGNWSTVIKAEMSPEVPGRALHVGLTIGGILGTLLLAALFFTRQTREASPAFQFSGFASLWRSARSWQDWVARTRPHTGDAPERPSISLLNAMAMATARLAEAEMAAAGLAKDLGLRDVMQTELAGVRARLESLERGLTARSENKSAGMVRTILRDLERIGRIIDVAMRDTSRETAASAAREIALPQTLQEAYDILGLNSDAAPNVAKKLVDALRMTWHPDFARDEQDRQQREARMKQINAAWDMVKCQPAEAA